MEHTRASLEKKSNYLDILPSEQIFYRNIPVGAPVTLRGWPEVKWVTTGRFRILSACRVRLDVQDRVSLKSSPSVYYFVEESNFAPWNFSCEFDWRVYSGSFHKVNKTCSVLNIYSIFLLKISGNYRPTRSPSWIVIAMRFSHQINFLYIYRQSSFSNLFFSR